MLARNAKRGVHVEQDARLMSYHFSRKYRTEHNPAQAVLNLPVGWVLMFVNLENT